MHKCNVCTIRKAAHCILWADAGDICLYSLLFINRSICFFHYRISCLDFNKFYACYALFYWT